MADGERGPRTPREQLLQRIESRAKAWDDEHGQYAGYVDWRTETYDGDLGVLVDAVLHEATAADAEEATARGGRSTRLS